MDPLQDRSSESDAGAPSDAPQGGKLHRIAGHTRGLVEDLREWIDLRLDLAMLELEERVDEVRNEAALGLTLAVFGFFAGLFGLTTVALGLGWALGHPFWGFLIVSVVLVLIVVALSQARPDLLPTSNLLEKIRGTDGEVPMDDRTVRETDATVTDREEGDAS